MYSQQIKSYNKENIVDANLEQIDPTPNIHDLFRQFNQRFFWDKLNMVEVTWSTSRMTSCAGVCTFRPRTRHCQIRLSAPLLSLRPRKDLVETLLHEMIHAFLFMTNNNRDRDDHGPQFHKHMYRINSEAGTNITVYHTFHDEVKLFKTHVWRCNGPCQKLAPFYGFVRRACNRPPGPNDRWFLPHNLKCFGVFEKIKEPPGYKKKNKKTSGNPYNDLYNLLMEPSTPRSSVINFGNSPSGSGLCNSNKTDPPSVNNKVREVWANKYPNTGKRKTEQTSGACKKFITQCPDCDEMFSNDELPSHTNNCLAKKHPCPACGVPVEKRLLESHLNTCLEDSINDDFFNLSGQNLESEDSEQSKTSCPICGESVEEATVQSHIDECLKNVCPICRAPIERGQLEEHLNVCLEDSMNEDDFNSSDIDISKKEEPGTVPCPICGVNVDAKSVNSHLDNCLSNSSKPVEPERNKGHLNLEAEFNHNSGKNLVDESKASTFKNVKKGESSLGDDLNNNSGKKLPGKILRKNVRREKNACVACQTPIKSGHLKEHLDSCPQLKPLRKTKTVSCPICSKEVDEKAINTHIDECLNIQAFREEFML